MEHQIRDNSLALLSTRTHLQSGCLYFGVNMEFRGSSIAQSGVSSPHGHFCVLYLFEVNRYRAAGRVRQEKRGSLFIYFMALHGWWCEAGATWSSELLLLLLHVRLHRLLLAAVHAEQFLITNLFHVRYTRASIAFLSLLHTHVVTHRTLIISSVCLAACCL